MGQLTYFNGKYTKEFYQLRSLLGNTWAKFYILVGGRCAGKSYAVMSYFLSQWKKKGKPFIWLRLTDASRKNMLANNGHDMIDADLVRKFDLEISVKGSQVYDHGKEMCKVLALSTFYTNKGRALYDNEFMKGYNICLDEMNREKCERKGFDICYAFVNTLHDLVRKTKENMRIFLIGNTLEECSDILTIFNFLPEKFGRFKLRAKQAILDNIEPSQEYIMSFRNTVSDLLMPNESTFTNVTQVDRTLVTKKRRIRPTTIIKFSKTEFYTLWDGKIISKYHNEKCQSISMRPFLDDYYSPENQKRVFEIFHSRGFLFTDLATQLQFIKSLSLLKPQG